MLDAAFEVFLERGYAGASVDAVVERAGGSKETLYSHFGSKAGLLKAIIEQRAEGLTAAFDVPADDTHSDAFLTKIAIGYLDLVLNPRGLALFRLVVAEAGRMPEVGDILFRTGPEALANRLAARLRRWEARGDIKVADPDRAAVVFFAMVRGDLHLRALLNPTRMPTAAEIERHAAFVVNRFLKMCDYRPG
jgi:AcrR family transcriptional regulator